ncbi:MAG: hypothetical protein FWE27_03765 [Defluviitaleaceae bacterium]|nr:hypothetical protein [Defluviitaleaceae bacterium]
MKNKRGSALVVAIVGGILMLSLVTIMLLTSNQTFRLGLNMEHYSQAFFTASSTLEFISGQMFDGNSLSDFGMEITSRLLSEAPAERTELFELNFPANVNMGRAVVFGRFQEAPPESNHTVAPDSVNGDFIVTVASDFAGYSYVASIIIVASDITTPATDGNFFPNNSYIAGSGQIRANWTVGASNQNTHRSYIVRSNINAGAGITFGSNVHPEVVLVIDSNVTVSFGNNADLERGMRHGPGDGTNNLARSLYIILRPGATLNLTNAGGDGWRNSFRDRFDLYILHEDPANPGTVITAPGNRVAIVHHTPTGMGGGPFPPYSAANPNVQSESTFDLHDNVRERMHGSSYHVGNENALFNDDGFVRVPPRHSHLNPNFDPFQDIGAAETRDITVTMNRVRRGR